jgi:hypothetical protein
MRWNKGSYSAFTLINCDRNDRCKGYFHHDKVFAPDALLVLAAALMPLKIQKMMGVEHDKKTSK